MSGFVGAPSSASISNAGRSASLACSRVDRTVRRQVIAEGIGLGLGWPALSACARARIRSFLVRSSARRSSRAPSGARTRARRNRSWPRVAGSRPAHVRASHFVVRSSSASIEPCAVRWSHSSVKVSVLASGGRLSRPAHVRASTAPSARAPVMQRDTAAEMWNLQTAIVVLRSSRSVRASCAAGEREPAHPRRPAVLGVPRSRVGRARQGAAHPVADHIHATGALVERHRLPGPRWRDVQLRCKPLVLFVVANRFVIGNAGNETRQISSPRFFVRLPDMLLSKRPRGRLSAVIGIRVGPAPVRGSRANAPSISASLIRASFEQARRPYPRAPSAHVGVYHQQFEPELVRRLFADREPTADHLLLSHPRRP